MAEIGLIGSNTGADLQYEVSGGYTADSGNYSATVLATDSQSGVNLPIATARAQSDSGIYADVGRIGVPLGLSPPAFAGRVPIASRTDTAPVFPRAALNVLASSDYGAAIGYRRNGFEVALRAYTPAKSSEAEQALAFGLLLSPNDTNSPATLCSPALVQRVCDLLDRVALGTRLQRRQAVQRLLGALTGDDDSPQIKVKVPLYALGFYHSEQHRSGLDVIKADFPSTSLYVVSAYHERNYNRLTVSAHPFGAVMKTGVGGFAGGAVAATYSFLNLSPYLRAEAYGGAIAGNAVAVGLQVPLKGWAFRVGYDRTTLKLAGEKATAGSVRAGLTKRIGQ